MNGKPVVHTDLNFNTYLYFRMIYPGLYVYSKRAYCGTRTFDHPWRTVKCTLQHRYAGDQINISVTLEREENGDYLAVITVFYGEQYVSLYRVRTE